MSRELILIPKLKYEEFLKNESPDNKEISTNENDDKNSQMNKKIKQDESEDMSEHEPSQKKLVEQPNEIKNNDLETKNQSNIEIKEFHIKMKPKAFLKKKKKRIEQMEYHEGATKSTGSKNKKRKWLTFQI